MRRVLIACAAAALAATGCVTAPSSGTMRRAETPEGVADAYMDAMRRDRVQEAAEHMDPRALAEFRSAMLSLADRADKQGKAAEVVGMFADVKDLPALRGLAPKDFFVAFCRGIAKQRPQVREVLSTARTQVLGHVSEGTDTAHVVYRMTVPTEGEAVTKVSLMSLRKTPDGWRLLLTESAQAMVNALERQLAQ
jgi:hypothetical protein